MNLLNDQNPVHIFLNKIGDIIVANLMFLLFCLPLITIGPSLTALYHCMLHSVKGSGGNTVRTFLSAFKNNFRQSFLVWVGLCFITFVLAANMQFWKQLVGMPGKAMYYFSFLLVLLVIILAMYIFPVIAAFYNTTGKLLKNAGLFALMHFPVTLLTGIITLLPMYMTYRDLKLLPFYSFCWFFFGFGLTAYINSFFYYRIFKPYLNKDSD